MRKTLMVSAALLAFSAPVMAQALRPGVPAAPAAGPVEYRGGAGSPASSEASNIGPNTTRSEIAPRLPNPDSASNSPEALMRSALRSLDQNKTGAAQQALEMAETRVLSRTTDPSMASTPDQSRMVQRLAEARRALGARDVNGAKMALREALRAPVPPRGPAVTTTYGGPLMPPPMVQPMPPPMLQPMPPPMPLPMTPRGY